ncbi:MAG: undecaprenyl-diphosphatase UppP [Chloroflexota bacterium]|nr:undecaprenyl-diphosphatase UppP [Dehalococcoidia bacterium]MDW8252777.1 undecaprenyl-diphosphatase UppP [Chloroflexota bacterium]
MDVVQAVILGAIQGLTEFLPISSSGHLVIAHSLFGWQTENDLAFDVALHLGTLLAVLSYFARDLFGIVGAVLAALRRRSFADPQARLGLLIIVGTIPAVVIGVLVQDLAAEAFRDPRLTAAMLVIFSGVMWLAERVALQKRDLFGVRLPDALIIGTAQAIALVPGVSRSGITISAGLFRGMRRADAARFSFLLAAPVTFGAVVLESVKLARTGMPDGLAFAFAAGILSSAVVGFLCIAFLIRFLARFSLNVFIVYRLALALLVLALTVPQR